MKLAALFPFLLVGNSIAADPICEAGDTICGESICVRGGGGGGGGGFAECVDGACTPSQEYLSLIENGLSSVASFRDENCLLPENECGGVYCPEGQECDANITCVATAAPTPAPTKGATCEDLDYCEDVIEACRVNRNVALGAECVLVETLCNGPTEEICASNDDYYYNPKDQGWQNPSLADEGVVCFSAKIIDGCASTSSGANSLMVGYLFGLVTVLLVALIEV